MAASEPLRSEVVATSERHLKWPALDRLEAALMAVCGLCLLGFTLSELADVVSRLLAHPFLSAQEFSSGFFVWGVFLGCAVAVRRDTHFRISAISERWTGPRRAAAEIFKRLAMLAIAGVLIVAGYQNYLSGFGSFMTPSETPIAVLYAAIPVSGLLIALFLVEALINGVRNGFDAPTLSRVESAAVVFASSPSREE